MRHLFYCTLFAVFGFFASGVIAWVIAEAYAVATDMSDFEGKRSYFVVGMSLLACMFGTPLGIVLGWRLAKHRTRNMHD